MVVHETVLKVVYLPKLSFVRMRESTYSNTFVDTCNYTNYRNET